MPQDPKRRRVQGGESGWSAVGGQVGMMGRREFGVGRKQKEAHDLIRDLQTRVSLLREEVEGRKRKDRGWERKETGGVGPGGGRGGSTSFQRINNLGQSQLSRKEVKMEDWRYDRDILEPFHPTIRQKVALRLYRICSLDAEQEQERERSQLGLTREKVIIMRVASCMGTSVEQVEEWVRGASQTSSSFGSGSSSSGNEGGRTPTDEQLQFFWAF